MTKGLTKNGWDVMCNVSKEFVRAEHHREMTQKYIEKPAQDVARIEAALSNGVWNPIQGPLCKFCAVKSCEYNRS